MTDRSASERRPNSDDGGAREEEPVHAPLMRFRRIVRSKMNYRLAAKTSDAFVRYVPRPLQRLSERLCDFPVSTVVRKAPLLLIRVPKTASASLSLCVYGRVLTHAPHRPALYYQQADPAFFIGATSFAVVRDPVKRLYSAYRWIKAEGTRFAVPNAETRRAVERIPSFKHFVLDYVHPAAEKGRLLDLDPVLHPQVSYVCDEAGAIIVGNLFKFETMAPLHRFLGEHGLQVPAKINGSRDDVGPPESWLEPDVAAAAGAIYRRDIAVFGYDVRDQAAT